MVREKTQTSRAGIWSDKGFTLLELTIILLLIGIILSFSLPKLNIIERDNLKTTTREMAYLIESLYDESILKRHILQLVIDLDKQKYMITYPDQGINVSKTSMPEDVIIKDVVTPYDGKITYGRAKIQFYPDGYVDTNVIHIGNKHIDYTLLTQSLTGKVKVLNGYVDIYYEE